MTTQPTLWTDYKMRVLNSPSTPVYIYRNGKEEVLIDAYPFTEALTFAAIVAVNKRGDALVCAQFRQYEGDLPRRIITSWQAPETTYYWNAKHQRFYYVYDGGSARGLLEDGTIDRGHIYWHEGKERPSEQKPLPIYQTERFKPHAMQDKGVAKQPSRLGAIHDFPLAKIVIKNNKSQVIGQVTRELPLKKGDDYPDQEVIPVLWEADGRPVQLDQPRLYTPSKVSHKTFVLEPQAVNNSGEVLLNKESFGVRHCAYVYTRGKLFDLNTLIAPEVAREWKLTEARDINDRGQIVGNAKKGGYTRAFLLTPR